MGEVVQLTGRSAPSRGPTWEAHYEGLDRQAKASRRQGFEAGVYVGAAVVLLAALVVGLL